MEDESGLDSSSEPKLLTLAELADELCPIYMAMGVPYDEYWHGDYTQLSYYRKAYEMQRELANHDAWIQGAYFYDALCMVSPLLHAFAKRGVTAMPYHKEPYGTKAIASNTDETGTPPAKTAKEIQDIQATNASARFATFMTQWNKRFDDKDGAANGNDRSVTD